VIDDSSSLIVYCLFIVADCLLMVAD